MSTAPERVLYLEDSTVDADLGRRALARSAPDTVVEIVSTVGAAIARLQADAPAIDVILADLKLPDGSGLDLLAHVRAHSLPHAFVVLTGSGDEAAALAALKAGADDYLGKHGDYADRLGRVLSNALERFRNDLARKGQLIRVLYAEPSRFDADLTLRHFAEHAPLFRIDVVPDGEEVLKRLPQHVDEAPGYDLLLLDIWLPAMDGLDTLAQLRERGVESQVIMISGHASVADQILDDVALARRYRDAGIRVSCLGGRGTVRFRMYPDGLRHLLEGWTKNFAGGAAGTRRLTLVLIAAWVSLCIEAAWDLGSALAGGDPSIMRRAPATHAAPRAASAARRRRPRGRGRSGGAPRGSADGSRPRPDCDAGRRPGPRRSRR